ncbi:hypothetical protein G6F56_008649 [Rhizopus delemar]|uniref:Peptidase A1 domain-containing protein n=1 Tax=Rhizopus stolonifer TaxID=4846 RepID=A0A367IPE6_RHIST|nr:hypothetical protein G6F56_008649 [Rhizopus delemar]RCH79557.1 hypothetical protein CU098_003515 [Rhizopus stolonifer]
MHFTTILFTSIALFSTTTLSATLEKRCGLKREPITMKNGLAYGKLKVGTPSQSFSVLFDTSQSLTWVPSVDCHTPICRKHSNNLYNPSSSSTANNLHKKESIKYSEGVCVDARIYQDTVSVAGLKVPNQLFGAAYSVKGLGGDDYLGYLGLGGYIGDGDVQLSSNTSSSSLKKRGGSNGAYASNAFQMGYGTSSQQFGMVSSGQGGFYQKRDSDEHNAEFIIGGIDHNVYKGSIAYFKLPTCDYGDSPYWKTELKCVKLGNKVDIKLAPKALASFDTGSSHILAPRQQADLLHAAIDGHYDQEQEVYKLKCCDKDLDSYPTLKFDFNGYRVSLPPKAYLKKDGEECTSLIGRSTDDKDWSLGGYFSRWFYQVFDASHLQIGLAIPKDGCDAKIEKL